MMPSSGHWSMYCSPFYSLVCLVFPCLFSLTKGLGAIELHPNGICLEKTTYDALIRTLEYVFFAFSFACWILAFPCPLPLLSLAAYIHHCRFG